MAAGGITKKGGVNNDIYNYLGERWPVPPGRIWGRMPLRPSFHSAPGDTRCRFVAPMWRLTIAYRKLLSEELIVYVFDWAVAVRASNSSKEIEETIDFIFITDPPY
jgi:hypothetical protein